MEILRTFLEAEATYRFPSVSIASPLGSKMVAERAGPSIVPDPPVPATVVMIPFGPIFRMRLFPVSQKKKLPAPSKAIAPHWVTDSGVCVAGTLSPPNPWFPLPANLEITPEELILRIT